MLRDKKVQNSKFHDNNKKYEEFTTWNSNDIIHEL